MRYEERSPRYWDQPTYSHAYGIPERGAKASLADLVSQYTRLNMNMMDRVSQMVLDTFEPASEKSRSPKRWLREDECGGPCYDDPCHCRCCICDSDLVVYTRLGERRIVPLRIENHRRRTREITLDLSDWTTRGGKKTAIQSEILPEKQFIIEPCAENEIFLVIDADQVEPDENFRKKERKFPDVEDCLVLYGDLKVEGCGIRPVRIALALLPRDCYSYVIHCNCSCCS
jgi:hypothetical protein